MNIILLLREILSRVKHWRHVDKIGPDILYTYWMLYFNSSMLRLCKSKFKHFGDSADFRPGAYAINCSKISIGERVAIRPKTILGADPGEIIIEDDVLIAPGVVIYTANHRFDNPAIPIVNQGGYGKGNIILKKGCWIGANSIILPGVTIGENSVIGAGSVVTKSIPARVVAAGNPAKIIKSIRKNKN